MNSPRTQSNEKISKIIQGTGQLGGYFKPNHENDNQIVDNIKYGIEIGINAIDTAENYGGGHTETLVGKAIHKVREKVFISTKFDVSNYTEKKIIESVDRSLKRLSTDYIDLLQSHWPNSKTNLSEMLSAMHILREKGKILNYGLGNPSILDLKFALKEQFDLFSVQTEYNLLERNIEKEIKPFCDSNGIITLAWSPLLGGRESYKITNSQHIKKISKKYNLSISQIILGWLNSKKNTYSICRTSNKVHMKENLYATKIYFNLKDLELIDKEFNRNIVNILPLDIVPIDGFDRKVYKSKEEALENKNNLTPSPKILAQDFLNGLHPKPIKVKLQGKKYILIEGRLKYWAWIIAFGYNKPIPSIVE